MVIRICKLQDSTEMKSVSNQGMDASALKLVARCFSHLKVNRIAVSWIASRLEITCLVINAILPATIDSLEMFQI
jgi:hypothetical protein